MSTTNGTRSLHRVRESKSLYTMALPNRKAIAERLKSDNPKEVWIVGSGWEGAYSLEDSLAAGALANLLIDQESTRLIDFDDCGFGWFMYDFASAISFIEDSPMVPYFKSSWIKGYKSVRELSVEDEKEIDTFIMLRRMALLAWIGSHIEAPEPQQLSAGFAETTAKLGDKWLNSLD